MPDQPPTDSNGNRSKPLVIGLCGGIASGKSTVAGLFAERGFRVLDADEAAREVSADPGILAEIRDRFGPQVLDQAGQLDRKALASRVFGNETARRQLEAILHPPIRRRLIEGLKTARSRGESVVLDVPLLLEGGWDDLCDLVVFLEVPREVREARARARGWDEGELERRESDQCPLAEKRNRSHTVVPNSGDLAETKVAIERILARL